MPTKPGRPRLPAAERGSKISLGYSAAIRDYLSTVPGRSVGNKIRAVLTEAARKKLLQNKPKGSISE